MIEKGLSRISPEVWASVWRNAAKRASDVAISLLTLVLLSPVFCLIAIAIKRDSPGPVIYRGTRMGRGERIFHILKFRTMYETPASYAGPKVTAQDDPRVTALGRWLRSTKLNELPQFLNVLRGEMSLVGPRPEDPVIAQGWPKAVRDEILSVRPGITSPASILYHNEEAMLCGEDVFRKYVQEVGPDKVRLDQLYVRHCSFCLDLDTLLWTILILAPRIGSHEPPERLLFVGPVTRFIRHYVNWFVADLVTAILAIGCAGILWRASGPLDVGWPRSIAAAVAFALLFSVSGAALGVNRIAWSKAAPEDIFDLLLAWAVATAIALGAVLWTGVLPFGLVAVAAAGALGGFIAFRYRSRLATGLAWFILRRRRRTQSNAVRALIIGSDQNAQNVAWILNRPGNGHKTQLFGLVDDDPFVQGMRICGADVVGSSSDIPELVARHHIGLIIVAEEGITPEQRSRIADTCRRVGTRFVVMPDVIDSLDAPGEGMLPIGQIAHAGSDRANVDCARCLARRMSAPTAALPAEPDAIEVG